MKKKTVYETTDGRTFDTKELAEAHELVLKQQEIDKQEKEQLDKEIREQASKLVILLENYMKKNNLSMEMEDVIVSLKDMLEGGSLDYYNSEEYYDSNC